jgi:hypothetical protein
MQSAAILTPMFAMFALTFVVWVYMYARRIPFITGLKLGNDDLTPARLAELSPPAVANPSDNLKNLFELPALFYAMCLYLFSAGLADAIYIGAAWAFVALRVAHSVVHCTVNIVLLRFCIYFAASLALWAMVFRAALSL